MKFIIAALLTIAAALPVSAQSAAILVPAPVPACDEGDTLIWSVSAANFECTTPAAASQPLVDNLAFMRDNSDGTKQLFFQLSGITTSTNRTWTVPDANITFPSTIASLAANTFTALQTMNGGFAATTGTLSSTLVVSGQTTLTASGAFSLAEQTYTGGAMISSAAAPGGINTYLGGMSITMAGSATRKRAGIAGYQYTADSDQVGLAILVHQSTSASADLVLAAVFSDGLVVGAPTGGDKGVGTINAKAVYDDNVLLTDWVFDHYYDGSPVQGQGQGQVNRPEDAHGNPLPKVIPRSSKRLYSLEEVRATTATERRLPWMPTKELFEEQRATGWMITSLWQGQEQQQLYLFEQDARIEQLSKRIGELEDLLVALSLRR